MVQSDAKRRRPFAACSGITRPCGLPFCNPSYNFDSAAGIRYTVDVSKPAGERVTITAMENGKPFDPAKTYLVALNSYRGSGGGGHLTSRGRNWLLKSFPNGWFQPHGAISGPCLWNISKTKR